MTNQIDIALTIRTSGWVEITNASKAQYSATIRFLEANRRHFDSVSFGYGPIPSHAIKNDRLGGFIAYAASKGLTAAVVGA